MTDFRTKTSRSRIAPRSSAYFQVVNTGRALCYRKRTSDKPGKWLLRTAKDEGGYGFEVLADADDFADANGNTVMDYKQALEAALGRTNADPTKYRLPMHWRTGRKRSNALHPAQSRNGTLRVRPVDFPMLSRGPPCAV